MSEIKFFPYLSEFQPYKMLENCYFITKYYYCLHSLASRLFLCGCDKIFTKSNLEEEGVYITSRLQCSINGTRQELKQKPQT